jgi:hypothetical protein
MTLQLSLLQLSSSSSLQLSYLSFVPKIAIIAIEEKDVG